MPLDLSGDPVFGLMIPTLPGPTDLDQVQDIMRRYERDNYSAFVQGLEPPRPQDPLDLPPVTGSTAPLDTAALTSQQIGDMMQATIAANEREVRRQREIEEHQIAINAQLMNRARAAAGRPSRTEPWHSEIMGEMPPNRRPSTEWGYTPSTYMEYPRHYAERERVLPRKLSTIIVVPASSMHEILRNISHTTAITGSLRNPEAGSIWGIPLRVSSSPAIQNPIMEVTDGVRVVSMHFPDRVLLDPNQLNDFQRTLQKRLDWEHEQAGDAALASRALPYDFYFGKKINRKQKVRSLIYDREK
jgi:hypothetical protein